MGRSSAQERDWPVFPEQRQRKAVRSLEGRACDRGATQGSLRAMA